MVILVRFVHPSKALSPILSTLVPMVTLSRLLHCRKALLAIDFTMYVFPSDVVIDAGISTVVTDVLAGPVTSALLLL